MSLNKKTINKKIKDHGKDNEVVGQENAPNDDDESNNKKEQTNFT